MKRPWPYWILPLLHFAVVAAAAFAVHYSNGINVGGFGGDYGLWMDLGDLGNRIVSFTRWAVLAFYGGGLFVVGLVVLAALVLIGGRV